VSVSVSILLPSYNHARFLPFCLRSVIGQTVDDWELIAVDDGSQDGSVSVLRLFDDPRIQFHENSSNLGTYGTLDRALSISTGEYVAVLNSDDAWQPDKLRLQIEALEAAPNAPFVYSLGFRIDETDQPIESTYAPIDVSHESRQDLLPILLERNDILASSVVFRRSCARFRPELRYSGDWVALLEPARTNQVAFVDEPLTAWRMHENNTFRRSPGQVQEEVMIRESILNQPTLWQVPRLSRLEVRRGLAACARHLSALYVLQGRPMEARLAARSAVRFEPGRTSIRRLAAVSLPLEKARRYLWRDEPAISAEPKRPLISFS
jgi:glycosyltransferase involved in cell wall biosynthesis